MRNTDHILGKLPTGRWLAKQRDRHSLSIDEVASALNRHPSTIRALERNNHVIPPGWSDDLRKLDLRLPAPAWPRNMTPYFGSDLERDLSARVGFRHSRYWLSKQLCVPEETVLAVIRGNLVVPHDWLLKLAELGANVPELVRSALHQPAVPKSPLAASAFPPPVLDLRELSDWTAKTEERAQNQESSTPDAQALPLPGPVGAPCEPPPDDGQSSRSVGEPSSTSKPPRVSVKWSTERGLRVKFCPTLVEQITDRLKRLWTIFQSGMHKAAKSSETPKAAEPSRG